jgi:hypothetical protein
MAGARTRTRHFSYNSGKGDANSAKVLVCWKSTCNFFGRFDAITGRTLFTLTEKTCCRSFIAIDPRRRVEASVREAYSFFRGYEKVQRDC